MWVVSSDYLYLRPLILEGDLFTILIKTDLIPISHGRKDRDLVSIYDAFDH